MFVRLGAALLTISPGFAQSPSPASSNVVVEWNKAALQAVRGSTLGPPMVARALAIVHTCIFEVWAAYDPRALGLQFGAHLRRSPAERRPAAVEKAISFAAYRCLVDLFPGMRTSVFDPMMQSTGNDPNDTTLDIATPQGLGNLVSAAVLASRRNDGSNQTGELTASGVPYADYTGYVPRNAPSTVPVNPATVSDVNHWQPLQYVDASGALVTQRYLAPSWGNVRPFSLTAGDQFRSLVRWFAPSRYGDDAFVSQAQEILDMSASLTDEHKMIAEYWADGPRSETPPGHWNLLAHYVSHRDNHTLDDDVKMFFLLNNALLDAGIVAWDAKRQFDSARPVTVIPYVFAGKPVRAWGGPGRGTVTLDGRDWIPYQLSSFPSPPFPEFVSGHSTFSAAAATTLALYTHSDAFGASVSFPSGSSKYEPGLTPQVTITLTWATFSAAARQAGTSRLYGGIHFRRSDEVGRLLGRLAGLSAWRKAAQLWNGATHEVQH